MSAEEFVVPTPEVALEHCVAVCKEKEILLPTYDMLMHPEHMPPKVLEELKTIGLWDINSRNLFRITWKNEQTMTGGRFQKVPNYIELPKLITGIDARLVMLVGRYFPTGAHKVGASYGPLVEKMVSGHFDPTCQKALWPSTGNYCRGGAFNSALLGCPAIAVLPAQMSQERFDWLHKIGAEVYATPGCESSVKAVFDKNNELVRTGHGKVVSLNQFAEFANPLWHYHVTGRAMEEVFHHVKREGDTLVGVHLTQGSAGTLSSTEYLRSKFPTIKVAAGEAWQCPTLIYNGYGDHRIEGIGDKHVPWVLNVKNLDCVVDIDDEVVIRTMHLFNQPAGIAYLRDVVKVPQETLDQLKLMGISSIANMIGCIKMAKYFEWNEKQITMSVCTDSMDMYQTRLKELDHEYTTEDAIRDYTRLVSITTDHMVEMTYYEKKRMHNLKYFTWVEQQGMDDKELTAQWYDPTYWDVRVGETRRAELDRQIMEFNRRTGMAEKYGL